MNLEKSSANFLNRCSKFTLLSAGLALVLFVSAAAPLDRGAGAATVCKKEIPRITLKNLSPPFKDYAYFQNRQYFPFEYRATSFSLINAWWLAEASTLVYADEDYVEPRLREAGLTRIQFFKRSGTFGFVAANRQFAIVAFRGSEIWRRDEHFDARRIMADLKTNINIRLADWTEGAKVHSGFKTALDEVWDALGPEIENLQAQGLGIWLTGHSLGAALATLAADRLQDIKGLYTFGSPRVGDAAFQKHFRAKAYRVVNGYDIVASVPGEGPFRHVGALKLIDLQGGDIHDRSGPVEEAGEAFCNPNVNATGRAKENWEFDSGVFIPSTIRDHVPLLYSILLWNELVASWQSNGNK